MRRILRPDRTGERSFSTESPIQVASLFVDEGIPFYRVSNKRPHDLPRPLVDDGVPFHGVSNQG